MSISSLKMKYIILLFVLFIHNYEHLHGQSKRDNTWIMGYATGIPGQPTWEDYGGMKLDFSSGQPEVTNIDVITRAVLGVANDEAGNLQFYTSGCQIFNKNNEVMEGGEDITMGGSNAIWRCNDISPALANLFGSTVILPKPNSDSLYLVFQQRVWVDSLSGYTIMDKYFYSEIDMSFNGGLGKVINKKEVTLSDTLHETAAVVRHGNGRDWWIVVPRGTEREFWVIPVTPEGVGVPTLHTEPKQDRFPFFEIEDDDLENIIYNNEYYFEYFGGQSNFTPDGTKYCRIVPGNGVEIFDFDRCNGDITLKETIPMPPDSFYILAKLPIKYCGIAISPNSRFLYFTNHYALFQYDLCGLDKNNVLQKIDYYDLQLEQNFFQSNFWMMTNAPDGKIYMSSNNGVHTLNVINEPNNYGQKCNFVQRGLVLPRWHAFYLNYFPNFRLYDLADSTCDTLGIDDPFPPEQVTTFDGLRVYPNPANDLLKIYIPQCDGAKIKVWNIAGQIQDEISYLPGEIINEISTAHWPAGTYFLVIYIDDKKPQIFKEVIVH
jgi:hypothetical protein